MAEHVQRAVYGKASQLLGGRNFQTVGLTERLLETDADIAQRRPAGLVQREGEHVGRTLALEVALVQRGDRGVVQECDRDLGRLTRLRAQRGFGGEAQPASELRGVREPESMCGRVGRVDVDVERHHPCAGGACELPTGAGGASVSFDADG